MTQVSVSTIKADGVDIFYRQAGSPSKTSPTLLLLHGYPSSSFMFRNLIPLLAPSYHVVAPDLPGFGFTSVPPSRNYQYTFADFAKTVAAFLDALHIERFAIYIFDYGAPTGLRLALDRPEAVTAIVSQNGNAYVEGFGKEFWAPVMKYWKSGSEEDRAALRGALTYDATRSQYVDGSPHPEDIEPETWHLDQALLERSGRDEVMLDLFYDYRTNVDLYPRFQEYFRESGVPVLTVWGKNDEIFVPAGAEAYSRDVKKENLEVHWLDAGHFALETNEETVARFIKGFLSRYFTI
ncbi:alpha/beta-hydrolase [Xylariomycetidae sp. FL2044]|nr:alpha/beta-hydrolase [Xylariomycetidae sp. FL2044]